MDEARAETAQQAILAENYNKQVLWQLEEMARLRREGPAGLAESAAAEIALKDKQIKILEHKNRRLQQQAKNQKRPFLIELAESVCLRPGCLLAMIFLLGILAWLLRVVR